MKALNKLNVEIISVKTSGMISFVESKFKDDVFSCFLLETPDMNCSLRVGNSITLLFKETEVSIGRNLSGGISLCNRIPSRVSAIDKGDILTRLVLDYHGVMIYSIISTKSFDSLELQKGHAVEGLLKANDLAIMEGRNIYE